MAAPKIVRIDFTVTAAGVMVTKYTRIAGPDGVRDVALDAPDLHRDLDLDWALAWCEAHGFTVRRWPTGARAFRGKPWPIRTVGEIKRRREQVERDVRAGLLPGGFYWAGLDFALDC